LFIYVLVLVLVLIFFFFLLQGGAQIGLVNTSFASLEIAFQPQSLQGASILQGVTPDGDRVFVVAEHGTFGPLTVSEVQVNAAGSQARFVSTLPDMFGPNDGNGGAIAAAGGFLVTMTENIGTLFEYS
jgi:hypothetical protein